MDADHELTITWIGHSTVVIEIGGKRLITDPALTRRLAHLTRRSPAPDVEPVDAVLISHVHLDHLHVPSLRRLGPVPAMAVPTGAAGLVRRVAPARLVELRAGDSWTLDGADASIEVRAVAADHSGRRGPHSRVEVEPLGFVVRAGGRGVYFAGDTDLFDGMADLGPIDVALVPIWGWGPSLGEGHLNPDTAARAVELIDPRFVVPIHWGTYRPLRVGAGDPQWFAAPLERFRETLRDRGLAERLLPLTPGGSRAIPASAR